MGFCQDMDLQPASFRGVELWVKNDKENYGRRIVTHEIAQSDTPFNEDLGACAQRFTVVAYTWGDSATADKKAVVAATTQKGAALLQLPAVPAFQAVCKSTAVSRTVDAQSYYEITLEFVADPDNGAMPLPISIFENLINAAALNVVSSLASAFENTFNAVNVLPFVTANAQGRVVAFANAVTGQLGVTQVSDPTGLTADIMTQVITLAQNAPAIVRPGPNDPPSSDVVATIGTVFDLLGQVVPPASAQPMFQALAGFTAYEATDVYGNAQYGGTGSISTFASGATPNTSTSQLADSNNAAAFNGCVRTFALIALAQSIAATTFTNRLIAIQARADLVDLFGQQLERTTDLDVTQALLAARDFAITALTQQILTLAPIVVIQANASLPALYWAARLYDDANRAQQLADLNDVSTPAFMPRSFEALNS